MAQARVTRFYSTRKRVKDDVKEVNVLEKTQFSVKEQISTKTLLDTRIDDKKVPENVALVQPSANISESKQKSASGKTTVRSKVSKTTKNTKKGKSNQTTVTKFYQSINTSNVDDTDLYPVKDLNLLTDEQKGKTSSIPEEIIQDNNAQPEKIELVACSDQVSEIISNDSVKATGLDSSQGAKVPSNVEIVKSNITRSPKRTLPIPTEVTPSKKKPQMCADNPTALQVCMPSKTKDVSVCRKLDMNTGIDKIVDGQKVIENVELVQPSENIPKSKQKSVPRKTTARTKVSKTTKNTKKGKSNETTVANFYQSVNAPSIDDGQCLTKDLNLLMEEQKGKCSSISEEIIQDNNKQLEKIELVASSDQVSEVTSNNSVKAASNIPESKVKSTSRKNTARSKVSKPTKSTKKGKSNQTTVVKFYQSINSNDDTEVCPAKDLNLLMNEQKGKTNSIPEEIIQDNNVQQRKVELVVSSDQVSEVTSNNSIKATSFNSSLGAKVASNVEIIKSDITRSPKRTLPIPAEVTPSKKKPHMCADDASASLASVPSKKAKDAMVCRKLDMNFPLSPSKASSSFHSPVKSQVSSPRKILSPKEKLNAMIDQSRSKLLMSPKLDELRKSLENFSRKSSMHSNPYKITCVISPSKSKSKSQVLPSTPAHERLSYLAAEDTSSLILPFKFRLLADMFRSMDTVISILHNRKEKITFDKVQDGIQKMMKRNFSKTHLGQIAAVLPSAYSFTIEKCSFMNKKADSKDYQLIITPVLGDEAKKNKKSKSVAFEPMHPQCLIDRRADFNEALLKITKKHHQDFLSKINFPLIPEERLKRWHPKFQVDSVSDVQPAQLPEPQESKIYTAKDVLKKVKGTFRNKVEKALQSVAEESKKDVTLELTNLSNSKPETSKAALKGICTDLLAKIRARESAKLLETMTRTPDETKRLAMLERLPKIIHIIWHYFIAERKTAVPIDVAVEKIIHSFNSLTAPDDVKDHLKLITETFPGWLSFIEIRKGVYIQIDKKRNINEMLDNFKH